MQTTQRPPPRATEPLARNIPPRFVRSSECSPHRITNRRDFVNAMDHRLEAGRSEAL